MSLRAHHLTLALILAGCSVADADPFLHEPALDEDTSQGAPSLDARALHGQAGPMGDLEACQEARIVGKLSAANVSCEPDDLPPGWTAVRLFEQGSPALDGLGVAPGQLHTFCAYEWSDPNPNDNIDSPTLNALHQSLAGHDADLADTATTDCRGQRPQGVGLGDPSVGIALRAAFRTNIDAVSEQDLAATASNRFPVDLALTDTISNYVRVNNVPPVNDHGLKMGQLLESIICPGGDAECLDEQRVRYTLALPRRDQNSPPDWQLGGDHGTKAELAMAIYEAVAEWQQRWNDPNIADPAPRLVVNMSVGFYDYLQDAEYAEGMGPHMALKNALEYASCSGALLIAAAGNSEDPTCPGYGPLSPAAFEDTAAPTQAQCIAKGFSSSIPQADYPIFQAGSYRPLVHAVGGLTEFDTEMINGRLDAQPRLAALGSNAIQGSSGTSSAAAVISGIAGLLWSYQPELPPPAVMQIIYDAGYPVGSQADFGLAGQLADVHRASVCAALSAACSDAATCPDLDCTAQPAADDGNLGAYSAVVESVLAASNVDDGHTAAPATGDICDETTADDNLSTPQPDTPVCEHCNVLVNASDPQANGETTHNLHMTIAEEHYGTITGATVLVTDDDGGQWKYVFDAEHDVIASLNNQLFPSIDVTKVLLDGLPSARSASIIFTVSVEEDGAIVEERSDEQIPVASAVD